MATTLLHVSRAITPLTEIPDAGILLREGVIEAIAPRAAMGMPAGAREINVTDKIAVPGFVDVHIHGAGVHDVMEGSTKPLVTLARTLPQPQTTPFLATTLTPNPESTYP